MTFTSLLLSLIFNLLILYIRNVENTENVEIYWSKNLTQINESQYDGYHNIEVGISITLECFASNDIYWGYPRNYQPLINKEFLNSTHEYRSTLTIDKTNSSHTGKYSCEFRKLEKFDADYVEVAFNLFVNDPERFLKTSGEEISIIESPSDPLERKFIPCLVTNSKLVPNLYNGNRSYINDKEVTYLPTDGFKFLIPIPLGSIEKLECKIDSPKFATILFRIGYEGRNLSYSTIISKNGIDTRIGISVTNINPREGDNVTIYCVAKAGFFNLVTFSSETIHPNGVTELRNYYTIIFQEVSKAERDSTYYRIARDFYPIKVSDTGKYGCSHNKSNGYSFIITSEELILEVADKDGNYPTKPTLPNQEQTTHLPLGNAGSSLSKQKLYSYLYVNSIKIYIFIAILLFIL